MPLTLKQQAWLNAYLEHGNATKAAREAGYSGGQGSLAAIGHENLNNPKIAEAIARFQHREAAQTGIGRAEVLSRAWQIAVSDQPNNVASLRLIADMEGWIVRKHEVSGSVEHVTRSLASLTDQQLRAIIQQAQQPAAALPPATDGDFVEVDDTDDTTADE